MRLFRKVQPHTFYNHAATHAITSATRIKDDHLFSKDGGLFKKDDRIFLKRGRVRYKTPWRFKKIRR